jgi:hypothetical protein
MADATDLNCSFSDFFALRCLSNLGQFSWVNRPNLRISPVYQSGSRNRLTLAQIFVHRAGGESAGPK